VIPLLLDPPYMDLSLMFFEVTFVPCSNSPVPFPNLEPQRKCNTPLDYVPLNVEPSLYTFRSLTCFHYHDHCSSIPPSASKWFLTPTESASLFFFLFTKGVLLDPKFESPLFSTDPVVALTLPFLPVPQFPARGLLPCGAGISLTASLPPSRSLF